MNESTNTDDLQVSSTTVAPNFFIVGTVKAGTTSLYNYLKEHPEVYMSPIKEPHHFSTDIDVNTFSPMYSKMVKTDISNELAGPLSAIKMNAAIVQSRADYLQLFRDATSEKAIGEASTSYLISSTAASEIYKFNPASKIIISLRNPLNRAYSHYLMNYKSGNVKGEFDDELVKDIARQPKGWGVSRQLLEHGFYYAQLQRYFNLFPRNQIFVLLFDELKRNPKEVMQRIFHFLEIDPVVSSATDVIHNKAMIPKGDVARMILRQQLLIKYIGKLIPKSIKSKLLSGLYTSTAMPEFTLATKQLLMNYYREDIIATQSLINKDLSSWLEISE